MQRLTTVAKVKEYYLDWWMSIPQGIAMTSIVCVVFVLVVGLLFPSNRTQTVLQVLTREDGNRA